MVSCSSNEDPNGEIPKDHDGSRIPEEFFGHYLIIGTPNSTFYDCADVGLYHILSKGTHMVFGGRGPMFPQEAIYLGKNTWCWYTSYNSSVYVNFKRNDKGQRILTASDSIDSSLTSVFIHEKDK